MVFLVQEYQECTISFPRHQSIQLWDTTNLSHVDQLSPALQGTIDCKDNTMHVNIIMLWINLLALALWGVEYLLNGGLTNPDTLWLRSWKQIECSIKNCWITAYYNTGNRLLTIESASFSSSEISSASRELASVRASREAGTSPADPPWL